MQSQNKTQFQIHIVTPKGSRHVLQLGDEHTAHMVHDFMNDDEKLQLFGTLIEENPTFAYNIYNNIPIPSPPEDEQGISAQQ